MHEEAFYIFYAAVPSPQTPFTSTSWLK